MGTTTRIEINHVRSRSPSVVSHEDDDLQENGVPVDAPEISPQYSVVQPHSHSGSSSHPGEFVHLSYPNELAENDVQPSDSASRLDPHERARARASRSSSARRDHSRRQPPRREAGRSRTREPPAESPTESGDSTEEFLNRPDYGPGMPRPQSYYGANGYTHSNSSGSYGYPQIPPSNQMIALPPQPVPPPYPHQYPHMAGPPPMSYAPTHAGFPAPFPPAPSQVSSAYNSPYGAPTIVHYAGPPSGYMPSQYGQQYATQQFAPQYLPQYPPQIPPFPQYMVPPAPPQRAPSPAPPASAHSAGGDSDKAKEEEILRKMEALMKAQTEERAHVELTREQAMQQAAEKARAEAAAQAERMAAENRIREEALRQAQEKIKAEAAAMAERMAAESRIREEARLEAIRAYEEKARAAAEQAAREQQIRKEAADAALKKAAEEAAAKAEKAQKEKKIAEEAAAAAKTVAEKEAAAAAEAAREEAKKQQDEAEKKLKEAEEAAAKAKAEAEAAEKKAAAAAPPEKKPPVRFKDAIGRNYNFPWERCCKWRDMEGLINQAFAHIDGLAEHVMNGRYDLIGPDKEIIMPNYWESTIEPNMHITMMLWPIPEPPKEPEHDPEIVVPPLGDDGILSLDDILNPKKGPKDKGKGAKKKPSRAGAFSMWMMGGAPSRPGKPLKGDKKPEVAAGSQRGAPDQGTCIAM